MARFRPFSIAGGGELFYPAFLKRLHDGVGTMLGHAVRLVTGKIGFM